MRAHKKSKEKPLRKDPVRLAVFDFDGTMINAQSGTQFAWYLLCHRRISLWNVWLVILWGLRYTIHLPHNQNVVRGYLTSGLVDLPIADVQKVMTDFHNERLSKYYRTEGLKTVQDRHEDGCVCLLVSATFEDIARAAGKYCGFDDVIATKMEVDKNGDFVGRVEGKVVEGNEKPLAIQEWADEKYGRRNWVLEYAYGDHHTDVNLLRQAQRPVAVNPTSLLKAKAKQYNWPIEQWTNK